MKAHCAPRALLVFAAILLWAGFAARGDTLVLKEEAYVRGPHVLLGEVAVIEGTRAPELATVELGSAALPGDSKRLHASLVEARIRNAGIDLDGIEVQGAPAVKATTLHFEVTRDMIAASLREFIELEMPWPLNHAEIDIYPTAYQFRVPDGIIDFDWRANPQYAYLGTGVFRGELLVDGEVQKRFTLKASVEAYGDVVVAATDIPRGSPLSPGALRTEKRALSKLEHGVFTGIEDLRGYVARTTIFPGQELTVRRVKPQILVDRNQVVIVKTRAGSLQVQTQARAMTPGAAGDAIICANLHSGEKFQGIVQPDGTVAVP